MRVGYWKGHRDGYEAGRVQALHEFERVLAVLREELADSRAAAADQSHRADGAVDLLLGHLGAKAISLAGQKVEAERAERHIRSVQTITTMPDPTDELPYGHPNSLYKSEKEARVDFELPGADVPEQALTVDG